MSKQATPEQIEQLVNGVLQRYDELGLDDLELQEAGGPSSTTMTAYRAHQVIATPRGDTLKKFDRGLGWKDKSAYRLLWYGDAPQPIEAERRSSGRGVVTLTAEQRDSLLDTFRHLRNLGKYADEAIKILGG